MPAVSVNACDAAFWQQSVALALGARKIGASPSSVSGVAKQLARLAGTAALAGTTKAAPAADVAIDFNQALQACSGT
jgi:hypothetical protein